MTDAFPRSVGQAVLAGLVLGALVRCADPQLRAVGPCSVAERAEIGARFIRQVETACDHQKPLSECQAYPALRMQYELDRKAAGAQCQQ